MKKRLVAFLLVLVILIPCAASAAGWYRLTEKKRLFNLPDYDSKVMDSYRADWALSINSAVDKTWASVTFSNGVTGYMERKFLVLCKSSTAWISAGTANLKHGPGSSFATVGSLSRGDSVTVLTQGNNWSFVSSSAGTGYIANSSLSDNKVSGSSGSSGKSVNYTAWVASRGDPVGLRSAPSGSNNVVFQCVPNTSPPSNLPRLPPRKRRRPPLQPPRLKLPASPSRPMPARAAGKSPRSTGVKGLAGLLTCLNPERLLPCSAAAVISTGSKSA